MKTIFETKFEETSSVNVEWITFFQMSYQIQFSYLNLIELLIPLTLLKVTFKLFFDAT